jgi:hypothetical protein
VNWTESWKETLVVISMVREMDECAAIIEKENSYASMLEALERIRDLSREVRVKSSAVYEFLDSTG